MSKPKKSSVESLNHEHEHGHNHGALGGHVHATGTKLKWAFLATFFILAVEAVGGRK